MTKAGSSEGESSPKLLDDRIAGLRDWRGETLVRIRTLIKEADPDVVETWKWMGAPVWEHDGIVCTADTYKTKVKLTFSSALRLKTRPGSSIPALTGT